MCIYFYIYTYIPILIYTHLCVHAYNCIPFTSPPVHHKGTAECPFHMLFYPTKHSHLQMTNFNKHDLDFSQGTMEWVSEADYLIRLVTGYTYTAPLHIFTSPAIVSAVTSLLFYFLLSTLQQQQQLWLQQPVDMVGRVRCKITKPAVWIALWIICCNNQPFPAHGCVSWAIHSPFCHWCYFFQCLWNQELGTACLEFGQYPVELVEWKENKRYTDPVSLTKYDWAITAKAMNVFILWTIFQIKWLRTNGHQAVKPSHQALH